jgi:hypothetical protein
MFLLVGMLGFLLLPNTVAAEYVDEYVAKHPRRVKITISQNAKGQYSGEALFKLFEHNVGGYRLKLDFLCDAKGPDLILLHCSTFSLLISLLIVLMMVSSVRSLYMRRS